MTLNRPWLLIAPSLLIAVVLPLAGGHGGVVHSQTGLDDETALSLALPALANGARQPVHLWARADQASGPDGVPTVLIVALYTSGADERETVNYVQFRNGSWAPARPRDEGTLLTDDWAWISLNLVNLSATAIGQGDISQYVVDYDALGSYGGAPRELVVEEVYGPDLALLSTSVLTDTQGLLATGSGAAPAAAPAMAPRTAGPSVGATAAPAAPAVAAPAASVAPRGPLTRPSATPAGRTGPFTVPAGSAGAPNMIRGGNPAALQGGCAGILTPLGYTWNGGVQPLGSLDGQTLSVCTPSGPPELLPATQGFGCLMIGNQAATLDGKPGCFAFASVQLQGGATYLLVQHLSAAAVTVTPITVRGTDFTSGQSYTACADNVSAPVPSPQACNL